MKGLGQKPQVQSFTKQWGMQEQPQHEMSVQQLDAQHISDSPGDDFIDEQDFDDSFVEDIQEQKEASQKLELQEIFNRNQNNNFQRLFMQQMQNLQVTDEAQSPCLVQEESLPNIAKNIDGATTLRTYQQQSSSAFRNSADETVIASSNDAHL